MILSFWVCISRHTQSTKNKKFAYLCNISRKAWGMKLIFCLQINTKVFYKVIESLWMCIARHAQSTKTNKFALSLQYLKENMKNEVHFSCMQINIKSFIKLILSFEMCVAGHAQITQNNFFCNILRTKWVMKLTFCMQISIEVS